MLFVSALEPGHALLLGLPFLLRSLGRLRNAPLLWRLWASIFFFFILLGNHLLQIGPIGAHVGGRCLLVARPVGILHLEVLGDLLRDLGAGQRQPHAVEQSWK